eukprot:TRINITY_DN5438_c0_g1_i2.p1 TRINITY_DN5438_c0_g1~~TRINITY_DN5438_c0_g1_i2.p1  ORF type:complete len:296 (+),score=50.41 TRINITY_DN5438_c0_g1_i2:241-1128(+)
MERRSYVTTGFSQIIPSDGNSAGSYENYRSDASSFPSSVLGKVMDGWPDEKWLDIRQIAILQPIMEARVQRYSQKGCDGVDPDNVDGYNDSGFDLSPSDQLAYNRMIATIAHNRNMSCGLKNDLDQIPDLVASFDYSVNEQCHEFNECDTLDPFIKANKPVFNIEYKKQSDFCPSSIASGYSSQMKNLALDQPAFDCRICNRISTRNNISCTASLAPPSEPASTAYAQTTPTSTMGTQNSNTKTSSTMGTQTSDTKSSLSPSSSGESDTTNDEESFAPILAWCFATTSAVIYLSL